MKFLYAISTLLLFSACGLTPSARKTRPQIICTTGYVSDLVKNIVGDKATVIALMNEGVDPHLYKPGLRDIELLDNADIIIYSGLHLEGKMTELLKKTSDRKPVYALSDALSEEDLLYHDEQTADPHFWFDALLWKKAAIGLSAYLQTERWAHDKQIMSNTTNYIALLDSAHAVCNLRMSSIPEKSRVLVTAHDAFGYFSRRYNIQVKALQGLSTQSEYGLRDITSLQNFLITRKIPAIFPESSVSPKALQAVQLGCRRKGWEIKVGPPLYSDSPGATEEGHDTYVGSFLFNVETITKFLRNDNPG